MWFFPPIFLVVFCGVWPLHDPEMNHEWNQKCEGMKGKVTTHCTASLNHFIIASSSVCVCTGCSLFLVTWVWSVKNTEGTLSELWRHNRATHWGGKASWNLLLVWRIKCKIIDRKCDKSNNLQKMLFNWKKKEVAVLRHELTHITYVDCEDGVS